jgi:hypothetical protein
MKKIIAILILFITLSIDGFSQENYLWRKRAYILNSVTKEFEKYNRKYTLSETDTTLIIHVNDSLSLPFYRIFYFNLANNSRCYF